MNIATLQATTLPPSKITFSDASSYLSFEGWWREHMAGTYRLDVPTANELIVTPTFADDEERLFCLLRWR